MQAGNLIRIQVGFCPCVVEGSCSDTHNTTLHSQPLNSLQAGELELAIDATLDSLDLQFGQVA